MGRFRFDPNARYRMPVLFGPTVGPRQGPKGETFDGSGAEFTVASARFLSDSEALSALLPECFDLNGDPVVTIEHTVLHDLAWLAGRSYSMLGVKLPVMLNSSTGPMAGSLLTVLWENRPEPILSGREELGFNKVYCELPEATRVGDSALFRASWDGHRFFHLRLNGLQAATPPKAGASVGTFHYAYMPPMGRDDAHETRARVMLSPSPAQPSTMLSYQSATPEFQFQRSSFEELPTMFQIVNGLASLPVNEILGGSLMRGRGKGDLSDQQEVPSCLEI